MFRTTQWSLVLRTRDGSPHARAALDQLCRIYRPSVLTFLRRQGYPPAEAEDLAQSFYAQLLECGFHARADPQRGRFRAYLLTALRHFLAHAREHDGALRRGGRVQWVPFGDIAPSDQGAGARLEETPEEAFDRSWALAVLGEALRRLRRETERVGKAELFATLRPFLVQGPGKTDYREVARRLGMRSNTVAVTVHRLRQRLRATVRDVLADTVDDPDVIDAELAALHETLRNEIRRRHERRLQRRSCP